MARKNARFYPIRVLIALLAIVTLAAVALPAMASSHREAPHVTEMPKVDGTDFYMFRSYEAGRGDFVTLIANYLPLQDPYGGPNYFSLDQNAEYAIFIDNDGDGIEDVSFIFVFDTILKGQKLPVGDKMVAIPLIQSGVIDSFSKVNRFENYKVYVNRGEFGGVDRGLPARAPSRAEDDIGSHANHFVTGAPLPSHFANAQLLNNMRTGGTQFGKPIDNIGQKTFPNYEAYAGLFVHQAGIPACGDGRVFVGQRKDPFVVNLGETFDLINFNPVGARDSESDDLEDKNVTSLILEVPISCLTSGSGDVIGGWTAARLPRERTLLNAPSFETPSNQGGGWTQVSRLGMPLVNEVVIGLPDKNLFNAARPDGDAALATYVTNPTLPELIEILFGDAGVRAPNNFPRLDLVAAFATGIEGLNLLSDGAPHEMLRLNTAIPPASASGQNSLGALAGDNAGFPNGRRPGDDVVDIELRVAMGVLCHAFPGAFGCGPADAPSGTLPFTDGALVTAADFDDAFPYLTTPIPGSPSGAQPGSDGNTRFTVTVENVSQPGTVDSERAGGAVPLSPGAWAIFTGADPAFTVGQLADSGTRLIGEDGFPSQDLSPPNTNGTELEILQAAANVSMAGTFSSPGGTPDVPALFPGESAIFTFDAMPGSKLQFETMFVQSNDWFYAFDGGGIDLFNGNNPISGDFTSRLEVYDAGTEMDTAPGTGDFQKPVQDPTATNFGPDESVPVQTAASRHPQFDIPANTEVIRVTITSGN